MPQLGYNRRPEANSNAMCDSHYIGHSHQPSARSHAKVKSQRPITMAAGPNDSCLLSQKDSLCLGRQEFTEQLLEMPKIQLHDHLEGSVRPQTILEEANRLGLSRPAEDTETMKSMISMKPDETLIEFLGKFDPFRFVFEDKESLKRLAYEAVEDNAKDGVKYVELRMNCQKNENKLSIGEVMDSVLDGIDKGSEDFGVKARFIASINRSYAPEDAMRIVNEAIKRKDRGVVGIDLAGDERHAPAKFKEAFAHARENGLQVTVHAGEALGASSIEAAIDDLGAERIGHGTRLREDRRVLERVRDEDVHLEMCPHSNRLLNVVSSLKNFPIREYTNEGISCSLNTDDKHIFDVNLIDEYKAMAGVNDFTLQELQNLNLRAIEHAFLPMVDKKQMIAEFKTNYERMNVRVLNSHDSANHGHISA